MAELITRTALFNDPALQGYWRFEDDVNLIDSSPNAYHLTNHGSVVAPIGKYGKGRDFEAGSSQYASIARANCANLRISGSQTWFCWVKPETLTSYQYVMNLANTDGSNDSGILVSADGGGIVYFTLRGLTTNVQVNSGATILSNGVLAFITGVYDASAQKLRIYINGVKVGEVPASGSVTDITSGGFVIGARYDANIFYDGIADDSGIFSRAFTDQEVLDLATEISASSSFSSSISRSPSASVSLSISPSASNSPSASISLSPSAGYAQYTRSNPLLLPTNTNDLATGYTDPQEASIGTRGTIEVIQDGSGGYMIHQFKKFSDKPFIKLEAMVKSSLAPTLSPVYLQVYNQNTNLWENFDSENEHGVDQEFELEAKINDTTNYKDSGQVITCRVYQLTI